MLAWIARGLHKRVVTSRYPRRPEPFLPGFRARVDVIDSEAAPAELEQVCPTGAIRVARDGRVSLDRGRCILCGACVTAEPERFRFASDYETAARRRGGIVVGAPAQRELEPLRLPLGERARPLRRSLHIRHVDTGSDGAEEWEIQALTNPYYDMQRLGLYFTLSPRHADILLVSGGVTRAMEEPLRRAYEVMPEPKAEIAAGVDRVLPVDVYVPGSPPSPIALLHGLLLAAGILSEEAAA